MSVSIVLATYNGAAFLDQQLDSLMRQTVRPAELILSDDGSQDGTVGLAERRLAAADFPVRILRNAVRKGYRRNFLDAAAHCRAPLVAFCDQDDVWSAEKLERMVARFDDRSVLLSYHNASLIDEAGVPFDRLYGPGGVDKRQESRRTSPWSFSQGFTQVFRRSLLAYGHLVPMSSDHLCPDEILAHDQWFFFLASVLGRIDFCDETLVGYRQHASNVFGVARRERSKGLDVVRRSAVESRSRIERRHRALLDRCKILHAIADMQQAAGPHRERAADYARHYRHIALLYRDRHGVYRDSVIDRAGACLRLMALAGERRRQGIDYTLQHSARDMTYGLLLGGTRPRGR